MGCWQETDALTHLPIYEDDPCVVVVMSQVFTEIFEKNHEIGLFKSYEDFRHVEMVLHGTYNDYGWIKEMEDEEAPDKRGVDRPFSQRRATIFFHERVWQEAVKAGREDAKKWEADRQREMERYRARRPADDWELGPQPVTPGQVEFKAVHEVAFWTRRDLMVSEHFHGCQSWENHYYDIVHALTAEMWEERKRKEAKNAGVA